MSFVGATARTHVRLSSGVGDRPSKDSAVKRAESGESTVKECAARGEASAGEGGGTRREGPVRPRTAFARFWERESETGSSSKSR